MTNQTQTNTTPAPKNTSADQKATQAKFHEIMNMVDEQLSEFTNDFGVDLTARERRRLIGTGVQNYGFIDKAFDIARDNASLMPDYIDTSQLMNKKHVFEDYRQLMMLTDALYRAANDAMLVYGDGLYRIALRIYGTLREQSRAGVPLAMELFDALLKHFHRTRRSGETPTEHELERDFHNLLDGKADGRLEITNVKPHASGGIHTVVDETHKGRDAIKASFEEHKE